MARLAIKQNKAKDHRPWRSKAKPVYKTKKGKKMKHFTALDFQQQATDEGFTYFNCIMANGLELQVTPLDWGWQVGVYDIDGRLIAKENQPFLVGFSGIQQLQLSHKAMLSKISDLYDRAIRRKVIPVKSA